MSYSGYLNNSKANALFKNTMYVATDRKYLSQIDQKTFDEISAQITTESVFTINGNQIFTAPLLLTGVAGVVGTYTITTFFPHNFIQGDLVTFSDIQGAANGLNGLSLNVNSVISSTQFTVLTGALSVASINSGKVTSAKMVTDYMHLYAVKCKYSEPVTQRIVATSGISPISIRYSNKTQIRTGMQITLSGMLNANANGTWYVRQINNTVYDLYTDAALTIPSTGGTTTSAVQGATSILWYEYAKPSFSDRKIDPYEQAQANLPQYESAGKFLKFYPRNLTCSEITMDYIKVPQIFIDVADSTIDLSLYYPDKYLYWIIDQAIKLFSTPLRDPLLRQDINEELIVNR